MLNPVSNLSTYAKSIGTAFVYVALDPTDSTSWGLLGLTEGDVVVDEKFQYNDYKLPEWTGDAIHNREVDGSTLHITVPLIWGDPTLYAKVIPRATKGGGFSKPQSVITRTVLIIPKTEVGAGLSNGAGGATWTPSNPVHALWIHKATFEPGPYHFAHKDGGKTIRSVGILAMFDATKPEGQMLYTVGQPETQGITTYRV